jgi:hypothetical protein
MTLVHGLRRRLANRIRELTADEPDVIEQRMSGRLTVLAAGNTAVSERPGRADGAHRPRGDQRALLA